MKKFILKISLFIIILLTLIGALLAFSPIPKNHYIYAYHNKIERLDSISGPRIILVGGSNLAFSIDSKMISDSLNVNVYNMGLHASIGLRYMLDSLFPHLKKDDIIVIMPEYGQFYTVYNGYYDILTPAFLYTPDKDIRNLNYEQLSNLIIGIPVHIKNNFLFKERNGWYYLAENFDEYGDEVAHRKEPSRKIPLYESPTTPIDKYAISDFTAKVAHIREKGCKVYLFWPITIESNYIANKEVIHTIAENLKQEKIQFSVAPDYFVQNDSMAFDTPYHLNGAATTESAKRFIKVAKEIQMIETSNY